MAWNTNEGSHVSPGQCSSTKICGCNGCCAWLWLWTGWSPSIFSWFSTIYFLFPKMKKKIGETGLPSSVFQAIHEMSLLLLFKVLNYLSSVGLSGRKLQLAYLPTVPILTEEKVGKRSYFTTLPYFCKNLSVVMYRKFGNVPIFEDFSPIYPYFLGFRVGKYELVLQSFIAVAHCLLSQPMNFSAHPRLYRSWTPCILQIRKKEGGKIKIPVGGSVFQQNF